MKNIIVTAIILSFFCIISAGFLSYVNKVTKPLIEKRQLLEADLARRNLIMGNIIDLIDFPDGEYEYKEGDYFIKFTMLGHRITTIKMNYPEDLRLNNSIMNDFKSNVNKKQMLELISNTPEIVYIYNMIKKALQSKITFKKYIVVSIPMINETTPSHKKIEYLVFEMNGKDLIPVYSNGIHYTLKNNTLVFKSFNKKNKKELKNEIKFKNDWFVYKKDIVNANYRIFYVGNIGTKKLGVITTCSPKGYGGRIRFLAAFDFFGKIKGIKVLEHYETPGLGAKIMEVNPLLAEKISAKYNNKLIDKNKPWFQEQFKGLSLKEVYLNKDKPTGKVDSITASTITSRALTNGVREALEIFIKLKQYFS